MIFGRTPAQHRLDLEVEKLECRTLLSVVTVSASGDEGYERFDLLVDGINEGTFVVSEQFQEFTIVTQSPVRSDQVRIEFADDVFGPDFGIDTNLNVDYIVIDQRRFETEDASTYASGVWDAEAGAVVDGFYQTEKLVTDGYFQFGVPDVNSLIELRVRGDEGGEQFNLLVDDQVVGTYTVTDGFQTIAYQHDTFVAVDQIRIEFINDMFDPTSGLDYNLVVDRVAIDGHVYETESVTTFASGVWDSATSKPVDGYLQTETLSTNGYFQYGARPGATVIEIDATGTLGNFERFELQIAGQTVAEYEVIDIPVTGGFDGPQQFTYIAEGVVTPDQIRIEFVNDAVYQESIKGLLRTVDRNLTIPSITVADVVYRTDDESVYSTGVWNAELGAAVPGFGLGDTLHTNGYFQFADEVAAANGAASRSI